MASDVCKHCTEAACLDVCPTGALFRTEFGTVVVQDDVCNGCGYCVPACPFGVIDRREDDGQAHKCTLCYDRLGAGLEPACAKACPTESIQFGPLDELRERAQLRVEDLHAPARPEARLYLATTRPTASAAAGRSSCCWTSPRSTACRRTRSSPPATCRHVAARRHRRGRAGRHGRRAGLGGGAMTGAGEDAGGPPGRAPARTATARPRPADGAAGERIVGPGDGRRGAGGEQLMVPEAEFSSYYGRPVIKEPVWEDPDVPATCSSAAWPARRRCWPPAPSCPATGAGPGREDAARSAPSACPPSP